MDKPYLSFEEQFKHVLNNEEIQRIEDPELRGIRWDFWEKRNRAFLDEARIPDLKLGETLDIIDEQEREALKAYCLRHNIEFKAEE